MKFNGKRILITQPILHSFCGSTVVTIELAEYLQKCGAKVEVYSYTLDSPVVEEFRKRKIKVTTTDDNPIMKMRDYDYIWIHSQVMPESLCKQLSSLSKRKGPIFIFLHMSTHDYIPDEFQWIYSFEDKIADKVLFISEEIEKSHLDLMEKDIPTGYFRNPAPSSYIKRNKKGAKHTIGRVLIVSNHAPIEVEAAASILRSNGIIVDHLGGNGKRYSLISPKDINNYDAIITIGKTVQYCLLSKKPAYVYDIFGGPGYLGNKNYKTAKEYNFSGRGFGKKDAETIADEIISRYNDALNFSGSLSETELRDFSLEYVLENVFNGIKKKNKDGISKAQELSIFYAQRLAKYRFFDAYIGEKREKRILQLEQEKRALEEREYNRTINKTKRLVKRILSKISPSNTA